MTPQRWQEVREVFEAALEYPPEERADFLARACRDAPALRREVGSLLDSHEEAEGFIESPPRALAANLLEENEATDQPGLVLGHYRLVSLIGKGGMGEVWLAHDEELGRKAAVKMLPRSYTSDEERVRRFEREARATSALNHPNILMIFEIGRSERGHYIAAEFVEGETLRDAMRRRSLGVIEALDVAAQICDALAAAHGAGIVHRDIKPENVMLRPDGYVKVLDFGLAKLTEPRTEDRGSRIAPSHFTSRPAIHDSRPTTPGLVLGTVSYMSPEQARGETVDARTDLFSLGVVLHEMIAKRPPFTGRSPSDVIAAILTAEPDALPETTPPAPAELSGIVGRSLRKERADRYQSAGELSRDLRKLKQRLEWEARDRGDTTSNLDGPPKTAAGVIPETAVLQARSNAESIRRGIGKQGWAIALVLVSIVIALSAFAYLQFKSDRDAIDSIAVLPFQTATPGPDAEYLSDGIADSIINRLSQASNLNVMSFNSVRRYKSREVDSRVVGDELNVGALLIGRVVAQGETLLISVELVDTRNGRRLWGRQYTPKPSDILAVQEAIAEEIAENLRLKLSADERQRLGRRHTENEAAYHLYLRGRYQWNMRTAGGIRRAIEYFEQAAAADSRYALAWAGLADCYGLLSNYSDTAPAESMMRAEAAAGRALDLDETLAEAHTSLGLVKRDYDWDFETAESRFRRALELNPNYATAWQWRAENFVRLKRTDEALLAMKRARERDPFSLIIVSGLGWALLQARQYDAAAEQLRRTLELDPSFARTHFYLGRVYEQQGRFDEAVAATKEAIRLSGGDALFQASLAHIHGLAGNRAEARNILGELQTRARRGYVSPFAIALVHAGLGETDEAFARLDTAHRQRDPILVNYLRDPQLDRLRSDRRYDALLERFKLTQ